MLKRKISIIIIGILLFTIFAPALNSVVNASTLDVWTENWRKQIFKTDIKPTNSNNCINLVVAKNEYEPAQILLRSSESFTINDVTFSNLVSGANIISSSSFEYNFVGYFYGSQNSTGTAKPIGPAPGYFPEQLLLDRQLTVPANTTQPIWTTIYIPKTTQPGTYTGTITINTSIANYTVNISVEVNDVLIPDAKDSEYNTEFWNEYYRCWKDKDKDIIGEMYGYEPFTAQYWSLMDQMANIMKKNRMNSLLVNIDDLLLDSGTTINNQGIYSFNWDRFDEFIQFFIDRDVVSIIAGSHRTYKLDGYSGAYSVKYLTKDAQGSMVRSNDYLTQSGSINYLNQLIPQLKDHLISKGWYNKFYMHVADESANTVQKQQHVSISNIIHNHAPDMKIGDAMYADAINEFTGVLDIWTPQLSHYESGKAAFDARRAAGEKIWTYTCCAPTDPYLNRFIDMELYRQELLGWYNAKNNITGFLHWGLMNWNIWPLSETMNDGKRMGDAWSIYPDVANNKVLSSIRMEAVRESCEDWELLKILKSNDQVTADGLMNYIVTSASSYTKNITQIINSRNDLVRACAGVPIVLPQIPPLGGISYWNFDEGDGPIAGDLWYKDNPGTINGASWTNMGKIRSALTFDGIDDYVNISMSDRTTPWTAAMWVMRTDSPNNTSSLVGSPYVSLDLEHNGVNKIGLTRIWNNGNYTFNYTAPLNQWVHLSFVGTSTGTSLYVNGQLKETSSLVMGCPRQYLGKGTNDSSTLRGTLDEVRFYDKALTQIEIAALAQ